MKTILKSIIIATMALVGTAVNAATPLQLKSDVFVEKQIVRPDGTKSIVLQKPDMVVPGDNLVFVVHYKNTGASTANNFVVTNPMPSAVAFNGTADGLEIVSVDGGQSWGILGSLKIAQPEGASRAATRADVTHIKWNMNQPLTAGAEGKLIFRGIVK
jgi:uncharacterized repeat protein (TIGR01451 family)